MTQRTARRANLGLFATFINSEIFIKVFLFNPKNQLTYRIYFVIL